MVVATSFELNSTVTELVGTDTQSGGFYIFSKSELQCIDS